MRKYKITMRGYIELKRSLLENEINKNCKEKEKGRNSYGENNMLMETEMERVVSTETIILLNLLVSTESTDLLSVVLLLKLV